jgi:hypothetical protein
MASGSDSFVYCGSDPISILRLRKTESVNTPPYGRTKGIGGKRPKEWTSHQLRHAKPSATTDARGSIRSMLSACIR